jgi:hypothetical protein
LAVGTITLYGGQECDFFWVIRGTPSTEISESLQDISFKPVWTQETEFQTLFEGTLIANGVGGSAALPDSWRIYRKKVGTDLLEFVAEVDGTQTSIKDYVCVNKTGYSYELFAVNSDYIEIPVSSSSVETSWGCWCLITANESDEDNILYADKIFVFSLNVASPQFSNNAKVNRLDNFTKYPKFQYGPSNYLSSTLTGLIGYVDCETGEYIEDATTAMDIFNLSIDGKRKFIKDIRGNMWEISLSDAISRQEDDYIQTQTYTDSIPWAEKGSMEGISLINEVMADE